MKKHTNKIFLGLFIIGLTIFLSGIALAGSKTTISGVINDEGQLVGDDGTVYEVTDNAKGDELMEKAGAKVTVTGTVKENEDADAMMITVSGFTVESQEE